MPKVKCLWIQTRNRSEESYLQYIMALTQPTRNHWTPFSGLVNRAVLIILGVYFRCLMLFASLKKNKTKAICSGIKFKKRKQFQCKRFQSYIVGGDLWKLICGNHCTEQYLRLKPDTVLRYVFLFLNWSGKQLAPCCIVDVCLSWQIAAQETKTWRIDPWLQRGSEGKLATSIS